MSEGSEGKRGEAAWKAHLDTISTRNAETRKRAREQRARDDKKAARRQAASNDDQAERLEQLNARVAKLRAP